MSSFDPPLDHNTNIYLKEQAEYTQNQINKIKDSV